MNEYVEKRYVYLVSLGTLLAGLALGYVGAGASVRAEYEKKLIDQEPLVSTLIKEGTLVRTEGDLFLSAVRPGSGKSLADVK